MIFYIEAYKAGVTTKIEGCFTPEKMKVYLQKSSGDSNLKVLEELKKKVKIAKIFNYRNRLKPQSLQLNLSYLMIGLTLELIKRTNLKVSIRELRV